MDVYRVNSQDGTFIANYHDKYTDDFATVISFNKGASWDRIEVSQGETCSGCTLHLALESASNTLDVDSPLSTSQAAGLLLANGIISVGHDVLDFKDSDVYVSVDGGQEWAKVLSGAHRYEILDHGSVAVATKRFETVTNFSYSVWGGVNQWNTMPLVKDGEPGK